LPNQGGNKTERKSQAEMQTDGNVTKFQYNPMASCSDRDPKVFLDRLGAAPWRPDSK
jgi:hypothetical protein